MTESEIKSLYSQIEGLSTEEIQYRINKELSTTEALAGATAWGGIINIIIRLCTPSKPKVHSAELEAACKNSWNLNASKILTIINNNPKTSKCVMDIILLLAPTIAQQFAGISGMAIVGTLVIVCKQKLGLA